MTITGAWTFVNTNEKTAEDDPASGHEPANNVVIDHSSATCCFATKYDIDRLSYVS